MSFLMAMLWIKGVKVEYNMNVFIFNTLATVKLNLNFTSSPDIRGQLT